MRNSSNHAALACPNCQSLQSEVIDSRGMLDGSKIRRRRKCLKCNDRFTAYEMTDKAFDAEVERAARQLIVSMVYKLKSELEAA